MKPNKILIVLFVAVLFAGCKNKNDSNAYETIDSVVKNEAIDEVPNVSDDHFDRAIKAYSVDNKTEAAKEIREGVLALRAEGKDMKDLHKVNLDNAVGQLESIAEKLDNNYYISLEGLKEAIVNAEMNVAHEYLSSTDDVYVLVKPKDVASAKTKRNFSAMISNLKDEKKNMNKEGKKDRDKLLKEGEALKKELADWEAKANAYVNKTNEHFKVYYPDYHYRDLDL